MTNLLVEAPRLRLACGLVLVAVFWWLGWHPAHATSLGGWGFFGLLLGYILVVDALTQMRSGRSLSSTSPARFAGLFAVSIPGWWLFEYLNHFLANWVYLGVEGYSSLRYAVTASVSFSTVIPAVFCTAELLGTFVGPLESPGAKLEVTDRRLALVFATGALLVAAITVAPSWFFPTAWFAVAMIIDPVLYLLGWPSLTEHLRRGSVRLPVLLAGGALVCGFFWEMWNYHSMPKWVYSIPHVDFLKVFEMPLLGYGGYLPFGLELYVLYQLVASLWRPRRPGDLGFDSLPPEGNDP